MIGNCSPVGLTATKESEIVPPLEIGEPAMDISQEYQPRSVIVNVTSPLSSFHYQVKNVSIFAVIFKAAVDRKAALALAILRATRS
jgi:hypothetical protein